MDKGYTSFSHDQHVCILWRGEGVRDTGTAEADDLGDGVWWVARVLVQPPKNRGRGIGTELVRRMQREVVGFGCKKLIVAPGGYDEDHERQRGFYLHCGFVQDEKDSMVWET